ncbi:MAG TPA: hypothetical protein VI999_07750 [Thermoplasmata archaeon]|nr:hypothetical protein [Thermoplasmata archaeon]
MGRGHAPDARGALPSGFGPVDDQALSEERSIEDERLELPALAARMDPVGFMEMEELVHGRIVPDPPEPGGVEALRRHAGEGDSKSGEEVVADERSRVLPPEGSEDGQIQRLGHAVHVGVLVVRGDCAHDDAVRVRPLEGPPQGAEFLLLPRSGGLLEARDPHRLRLECGQVQVRHVEHHRLGICGPDRDERADVPTALQGHVGRVRGVLSSGEQAGDPHAARMRAQLLKDLREVGSATADAR